MRYLNGFILTGIALFFISIAGLVKGNTLLTEPGLQPNPYAWLEYLAAAVIMLVNGAVSIWVSNRNMAARRAREADEAGQAARQGGETSSTS